MKYPRHIFSLLLRLILNAWKTKYVASVKCICGSNIDVKHIFFDCRLMKDHLNDTTPMCTSGGVLDGDFLKSFLYDELPDYPILPALISLSDSPVYQFL